VLLPTRFSESSKPSNADAKNPLNSAFVARYFTDPVSFVHECFVWPKGSSGAAFYQEDVLRALPVEKRVSVRGPHGLGKTSTCAWVVLWFALTREAAGIDWKVPTTASAWRQLEKYLWPEITKWARRLNWEKIGFRGTFNERTEMLKLNLNLKHGEAFALASDNSVMIEGAHADSLLYLFDESKAIPPATWDSAEGAFSTGDTYWLSVSTPGEPVGRFYDIQKRRAGYEDWFVRHVSLAETIASGRVSKDWAEARARQWGEESAVYANRVKGEFASSDEDGVIPLSWVELANERWEAWNEAGRPGTLYRLGVDVGTTGDKTVFARRLTGNVVASLEYLPKPNPNIATMEITGKVKAVLRANPQAQADIDGIGLGAGIVHRLVEQKEKVLAFIASERSELLDSSGELGFANKRAAAWWTFRELLDPASESGIAIPPDDILTGDLTAPKYSVRSGGKILIESKEEIKKRIGRSTDAADAVIMAFFTEPVKPPDKPGFNPMLAAGTGWKKR
jgi:hypothetical protein